MKSENSTEKKSPAKKALSIIGNILIWAFIVFSVIATVLAFAATSSPDGVPAIGGYAILSVQSPSMKPTFNEGDIIFGRKISEEERLTLKVGDVITYVGLDYDGDGKKDLNSHRIVEVQTNDAGTVTAYVTRGDNKDTNTANDDPVSPADIISIWEGAKINGLGKVLAFLQQPTGFLVVIVIPLIAFFVFELVLFIRKFLEFKNAGKKQISKADEELIKQKAIEEYIRQQKEKEAAQNSSDDSAE